MSAHNSVSYNTGSSAGCGRTVANHLSSLPALAIYGTVAALLLALFGLDPAI
jgi:hypothetical protein